MKKAIAFIMGFIFGATATVAAAGCVAVVHLNEESETKDRCIKLLGNQVKHGMNMNKA